MTLDPELLGKAVERERWSGRRNQFAVLLYAWLCFGAISFVFASVGRVPFPQRIWMALLGGLIGGVVTMTGVRAVHAFSQRGMRALLEPGEVVANAQYIPTPRRWRRRATWRQRRRPSIRHAPSTANRRHC